MMDSNNCEVDVCQTSPKAALDDQVIESADRVKQLLMQQPENDQHSGYLTAAELMNLRNDPFKTKSNDDIEVYKGPKLYAPLPHDQDEKMTSILNNYKNILKLHRVTKIKDCMKAEWIDDLQISVVAGLKGKTTQHMGHNHEGQIALSPEESLYLLQKNAIEIKRNNMPMSIEEAFSVMLEENLGLEKYQVYAHLSQQGFIVVHHQSRVGPNAERSPSKKRKAVNKSAEEPQEKRTTFSGVLASNSQATMSVPRGETTSNEGDEFFPNTDSVEASETASNVAPESIDEAVSSDAGNLKLAELLSSADIVPDSTNHANTTDLVEKEVSEIQVAPVSEESHNGRPEMAITVSLDVNHEAISSEAKDPVSKGSPTHITEVSNSIIDDTEKSSVSDGSVLRQTNGDGTSSLVNEVNLNLQKNQVSEWTEKIQNESIAGKKDDKTKNKSDDDADEVLFEEDRSRKYCEYNVEDSSSSDSENDGYEVSDKSNPVVCGDSSEDLDVISCSVCDLESSYDSFNSANKDVTKEQDDEVTLVEVKKKENKPLAVIDLLSDDEVEASKQNEEETFEGSDDEIQVVKVCPKSANPTYNRNSSLLKSESKPNLSNVKGQVGVKSYQPVMQFPNLFKKDMYCISRPLVTLLPSRVRPAKEVYVINRKKSQPNQGRVWESFRDLQDYQRDRRIQRQMGNPERPFSSLRDYRFHRDSCSPRVTPFNRDESFRETDFERNNHSGGFQQHRDPFTQIPNHNDRHSPMLSSHDPFGSLNSSPFLNMHNSNQNPAFIVNEIHRTIHSVTSNIIHRTIQSVTNSILGPSLSHLNPLSRSSPTLNPPPLSQLPFNNFPPSSPLLPESPSFNSMQQEFRPMPPFQNEPVFLGDRHSFGMSREAQFDNSWPSNMRRRNTERKGPLFPRAYKDVRRKRCWSDIKSSEEKLDDKESDSGNEIEEVPINLNQFLWSNDIQPLVKPGTCLPVSEVLQKIRITQFANLMQEDKFIDSSGPRSTLEISFDVYLPGFKYKKTAPDVPKLRIIVLRSTDPIPRYSEIILLKKKFSDSAVLQLAVVDHGDISFYSFNSVSVPDLVPFKS